MSYCGAVPGGYGGGLGGLGYGGGLGGVGYGGGLGGLGYGGGLGLGSGGGLGYGGGLGLGATGGHGGLGGGLGNGLGIGYGAPLALGAPGPLPAAIHTQRTYEVIPVNTPQEPAVPQVIDVEPNIQPVQVIFRTVSSPVLVQQIHTPGEPGQSDATRSEDEPHRVLHEVLRPVIQEVREVIQPYRRVTQEVRPVLEEVHTVVAKGDRSKGSYGLAAPAIAADAGVLDYGGGLGGLGLSAGKGYKSAAKKAA